MEADRTRLRLYLFVFTALLLIGSFGFMYVENLSLVDSIYFAIVTMATVGYGDIHPQSNLQTAGFRVAKLHVLFKK